MIVRNPCGNDTITKKVCIESPITPSFTLNPNSGCIPLNVTTTNTSIPSNECEPATYNWAVSYLASNCGTSSSWNYTSGTNSSSFQPSFIFNNSGTYTITLSETNKCGTYNLNKVDTVKKPPTVTLSPISNSCGPASIVPLATVVNCGSNTLTYSWTFGGGTPATSTLANPGSISFSSVGTHNISLSVTNECGTVSSNASFNINPQPIANACPNVSICLGQSTTLSSSGSGGTPGYTYSWSSIPTGFTSSLQNPVVSPTITTTYFLSVTDANSCIATNQVVITVNPLPNVTVNSPTICTGQSITLTANGANTYIWSNASTASSIIVNPTVTTSYTVTGTTTLTGCTKTVTSTVTVNSLL